MNIIKWIHFKENRTKNINLYVILISTLTLSFKCGSPTLNYRIGTFRSVDDWKILISLTVGRIIFIYFIYVPLHSLVVYDVGIFVVHFFFHFVKNFFQFLLFSVLYYYYLELLYTTGMVKNHLHHPGLASIFPTYRVWR